MKELDEMIETGTAKIEAEQAQLKGQKNRQEQLESEYEQARVDMGRALLPEWLRSHAEILNDGSWYLYLTLDGIAPLRRQVYCNEDHTSSEWVGGDLGWYRKLGEVVFTNNEKNGGWRVGKWAVNTEIYEPELFWSSWKTDDLDVALAQAKAVGNNYEQIEADCDKGRAEHGIKTVNNIKQSNELDDLELYNPIQLQSSVILAYQEQDQTRMTLHHAEHTLWEAQRELDAFNFDVRKSDGYAACKNEQQRSDYLYGINSNFVQQVDIARADALGARLDFERAHDQVERTRTLLRVAELAANIERNQ